MIDILSHVAVSILANATSDSLECAEILHEIETLGKILVILGTILGILGMITKKTLRT